MKTDELAALLANDAGAVAPDATARRFTAALGWGLCGTALAMAIVMGVRPDIAEAVTLPMFWMKLAFPASIAIAACYAAARLARPGVRLGRAPGTALAALLATVWMLAIAALLNAAPAERSDLVFGDTWRYCLVNIPLLSIPVFGAAMWALKGLAPTRLALAGGAAGLLAGAVSAAVYSLHCPEMELPFLAVWYLLGMLVPAIAGAVTGPRLLRW
ncbi:DUF1109 domain-containing protein [Massilia cavernae]|uniref:DUF1109 domain-containing protein n=1 Tax=Massilia cavernae TaxID=2320864 RepID=A0A418XQG5_9BURK|nr:DUF1109 domain-containing protein [Massilia cavernae]RJG14646.1 DUF1109 domain-containing protein [Massilia cavernae]